MTPLQRVARHVRLDDHIPRMGQRRKRSPYEKYLAGMCGCNHPGAAPPCSGCTSAMSEEEFEAEFARVRPGYIADDGAVNEIVWAQKYEPD